MYYLKTKQTKMHYWQEKARWTIWKKSHQSWVDKTETTLPEGRHEEKELTTTATKWGGAETKSKLEYVNHSDKHQHTRLSYLKIRTMQLSAHFLSSALQSSSNHLLKKTE